MGDFGFKYSLPLKSTLGNNNPKELGYSSKFQTLETFKSGRASKAASAGALTTLEIAHGLPYRPAFNAYYRDTLTGEVYQCMSGFEEESFNRVAAEISVHAKVNNYNLIFSIYNNAASTKNVDVFYEIFIQDLTTEPQFFIG